MIRYYYLLLAVFVLHANQLLLSQVPAQFSWGHKIESLYTVNPAWTETFNPGSTIVTDHSGNIIIAGNAGGAPVDLDDSQASYLLPVYTGNDGFVASYTHEGLVRWGFVLGGSGFEVVTGVAVNALGEVYVSGMFEAAIDLDPGQGTTVFTPADGDRDIFIAKYDSTGAFIAAMQFITEYINPSCGYIYKMEFDDDLNLVVAGTYLGNMDADGGPDTLLLPLPETQMTKGFIAKYTSDFELLQTSAFASSITEFYLLDLAMDAEDGYYISGEFQGTTDFDTGNDQYELYTTNRCGYIARYNAGGALLWAKKIQNDLHSRMHHICLTTDDGVVVAGDFAGDLKFGMAAADTIVFDWSGDYWDQDLFVAAYNSDGGGKWAKHIPQTTNYGVFSSMTYKANDNTLYLSFSFSNGINLDLGNSDFTLNGENFPVLGMGLVRYNNADGSFISGAMFEPNQTTYNFVHIHNNELFMLGSLLETLDVDFTAGEYNLSTTSPQALFLTKYCHAPEELTLNVPDTIIACPGSTISIVAGGAENFEWFDAETEGNVLGDNDTLQYIVTESQWLYAEGINSNCRSLYRKGVYVQLRPVVQITDTLLNICVGDTVVIPYVADADALNSNFPAVFSDGGRIFKDTLIWLEGTGLANACSVRDSIRIHVLRLPQVTLHLETDTLCVLGALGLTGGLPEGGTYGGENVSGGIFTTFLAGQSEIWYEITDTNLCTSKAFATITVETCLSVYNHSKELNDVQAIYHPGNMEIRILGNLPEPLKYTLYSADGREIKADLVKDAVINLAGFSTGIYLVRLIASGNSSKTFRVLKHSGI